MTTVNEALEQVRNAGFTVLYGFVKEGKAAPVELDVDLDDLLVLPQQHVPVVFFDQDNLEIWDFEVKRPDVRSAAEQWQTPAEEQEIVDLVELEPGLRRFTSRQGEAHTITFRAPLSGVLVTCTVAAEWYGEFIQLQAQALERMRTQEQARIEAQREVETAQQEQHVQRLRLLVDDGGFLKLARLKSTAQRTLLTYARTHEREAVEALGEAWAKEVLAEVRDLVLLKKMEQ